MGETLCEICGEQVQVSAFEEKWGFEYGLRHWYHYACVTDLFLAMERVRKAKPLTEASPPNIRR